MTTLTFANTTTRCVYNNVNDELAVILNYYPVLSKCANFCETQLRKTEMEPLV